MIIFLKKIRVRVKYLIEIFNKYQNDHNRDLKTFLNIFFNFRVIDRTSKLLKISHFLKKFLSDKFLNIRYKN